MMGLENTGEIPFQKVYLSGLIRDEQGAKMSKTRGNVTDPIEAIGTYGTDALRFTLTTGNAPGNDLRSVSASAHLEDCALDGAVDDEPCTLARAGRVGAAFVLAVIAREVVSLECEAAGAVAASSPRDENARTEGALLGRQVHDQTRRNESRDDRPAQDPARKPRLC